jgi:hypothetical protein
MCTIIARHRSMCVNLMDVEGPCQGPPGGHTELLPRGRRSETDNAPAPPLDEEEIARTVEAGSRYGLELV